MKVVKVGIITLSRMVLRRAKKLWKQDELQLNLFPLNSPVKDTVVVNDRWGVGAECRHGGFFTCQDRYNPGLTFPKLVFRV